jgi:hypothetical protein
MLWQQNNQYFHCKSSQEIETKLGWMKLEKLGNGFGAVKNDTVLISTIGSMYITRW